MFERVQTKRKRKPEKFTVPFFLSQQLSVSFCVSSCVCALPACLGSARPGVSESRGRLTLRWAPVSRRGMQPPTITRPTFFTHLNIFSHCVEMDYVTVKQCGFLDKIEKVLTSWEFPFRCQSLLPVEGGEMLSGWCILERKECRRGIFLNTRLPEHISNMWDRF